MTEAEQIKQVRDCLVRGIGLKSVVVPLSDRSVMFFLNLGVKEANTIAADSPLAIIFPNEVLYDQLGGFVV